MPCGSMNGFTFLYPREASPNEASDDPIKGNNVSYIPLMDFVVFRNEKRTKLDPKSRKCIFLGYADNVKGYRLWDPTAHKVIVSRNVVFAENELQNEQTNNSNTKDTTIIQIEKNTIEDEFEAKQEHKEQKLNEVNDEEAQ
ncbi:hypothetical protein CR513_02055, partial [Mucuna pruriens]